MKIAVKEIMSTKLETIDVTQNAQEAAKKIDYKKISSLLVIDSIKRKEEPIGIVTERDLVSRICAAGGRSKDVGVRAQLDWP